MIYVNPYLLLKLNNNFENISGIEIKKAKRKLLADIELSDKQLYNYQGVSFNKYEVIKIIDELGDIVRREFHLYIIHDKKLLNFLSKGDLNFFKNYEQRDIYTDNEFIKFISPYFAYQFDISLVNIFRKNEKDLLQILLSVVPHVTKDYYEKCYESTYKYIEQIINELSNLTKEIKSKNEYKNLKSKIVSIIKGKIDFNTLNLLPQYFQDINSRIVMQLNRMSVVINDNYTDYELALNISEIAYNILNADTSIKETVLKNLLIYQKNIEDQKVPFENILNSLTDINNRIKQYGKNSIDAFKLQNFIKDILIEENVKLLLNPKLLSLREGIISQLIISINYTPYYYKIQLYKYILNSYLLDEKTEQNIIKIRHNEQRKHKLKIYFVYASIIIFVVYLIINSLYENNTTKNDSIQNSQNNYSTQPNYDYYNNQHENIKVPNQNNITSPKTNIYNDNQKSALLSIIQSQKNKLKQMENDIRNMNGKLNIIQSDIIRLKQKLDSYDADILQGKYVNQSVYNSIVNKHNGLAKKYNQILVERNDEYYEYKNLINEVNINVRKYNN